jgi:prolyl-tRNA editing enzyme YbaK/EbsC (Cys-tRNA(Pro) deacylase)
MLPDFIEANNLKAKVIFCAKPVATAQQAAGFLKVPLECIAKTILFILDSEKPVLCILSGSSRASTIKLCSLLNSSKCRIAKPEEVLEITGYEIGALPPVSVYGVPTILDSKLAGMQEIISGGGSVQHLLRISPKEVLEFAFECKTADICE